MPPATDAPSCRDDPHRACESLFQRFGACIDQGRATEAIDAFAPDCLLEIGGRIYRGGEEVLAFLREREAQTDRSTRHLGANFLLGRVTESSVEAQALIVVFAGEGPGTASPVPEFVTDCLLRFVRTPSDGWRVASRRHIRFAQSRLSAESRPPGG